MLRRVQDKRWQSYLDLRLRFLSVWASSPRLADRLSQHRVVGPQARLAHPHFRPAEQQRQGQWEVGGAGSARGVNRTLGLTLPQQRQPLGLL